MTVAPLVGAWIEITLQVHPAPCRMSLLSWERGLKFTLQPFSSAMIVSLLSWERGLK